MEVAEEESKTPLTIKITYPKSEDEEPTEEEEVTSAFFVSWEADGTATDEIVSISNNGISRLKV